MKFKELNLEPQLLEGLDAMGFEEATPIQELALPIILAGKDLIACAQTGTGKTGAFLLPILNKITKTVPKGINTVIISPTRELAQQIDKQVEGFGYFTGATSCPIYGGGDGNTFEQQKKALTLGADIIIATPGRLLSHLGLGYAKLDHVEHIILDEADRMLDMGFNDDIMRIIDYMPKVRQTLMFSATMPPKIRQLAKKILKSPEEINIAISKPAEGILQGAYLVQNNEKIKLIQHLIKGKDLKSVIVFSSTKKNVSNILRGITGLGFNVKGISSDLEQDDRENALLDFKNRKTQIIVATDILSRGIDIDSIELVINFDVPNDAEDYIHRVGRTARAATTGVALTFIDEQEVYKFKKIDELIGDEVPKLALPEGFAPGPRYDLSEKSFKPRQGGGGGNRRQGGGGNRNHRNKKRD
ncbi:MAG: ATP-dependent RNA helicase RhlE [Sphingobacteriales bacterium]|jgi:ATP-dependent RNA helicase RhlE